MSFRKKVSVLSGLLFLSSAPTGWTDPPTPTDPCEKVTFSYQELDNPFYDDANSRYSHDPSTADPKTMGLTVTAKATAGFLRLVSEPFTRPEQFCHAMITPVDQLYRDSTFENTAKNDPKFFDWLKMLSCRVVPSDANNFAAINTGNEFAGDDKHLSGYCAGFSSIVKKFTYLAFFKPANPPQAAPTDPIARKKWCR